MDRVKVKLANGIEMVFDATTTNTEMIVALGMIVNIMLGSGEFDWKNKKEQKKFRKMINTYVKEIIKEYENL